MHVEIEQRKAMHMPFLLGATLGSALVLAVVALLLIPSLAQVPEVRTNGEASTTLVGCIPAQHDLQAIVAENGADVVLTLDGTDLATLAFSSVSEARILSQDGCTAFVVRRESHDVGGYMLYPIEAATSVYRISLDDRQITKVYEGLAGDVTVDPAGQTVALLRRDGANASLRQLVIVRDIVSSDETSYVVASTYTQSGDLAFSPNGEKIAYATAVGNPDKEQGAIFIIDRSAQSQSEYQGNYRPFATATFAYLSWVTNDMLEFAVK